MKNRPTSTVLKNKSHFLPVWIWVILAIELIVPLIGATAALIDPSFLSPDDPELTALSSMFVVRNYAAALGVFVAILMWSEKALFTVLSIRLFMDLGDMYTMIRFDGLEQVLPMILFMIVVLIILPILVLRYLWSRIGFD